MSCQRAALLVRSVRAPNPGPRTCEPVQYRVREGGPDFHNRSGDCVQTAAQWPDSRVEGSTRLARGGSDWVGVAAPQTQWRDGEPGEQTQSQGVWSGPQSSPMDFFAIGKTSERRWRIEQSKLDFDGPIHEAIGAIHPMETRPCRFRLRSALSAYRRSVRLGTGSPIGCHYTDCILRSCGRDGAPGRHFRSDGQSVGGRVVVTRPCHLWRGRHSGTTAATATTDVADVADVSNAAPTPVLFDAIVLVVHAPTAVALINAHAARSMVALPAPPTTAARCIAQRWGSFHFFLSCRCTLGRPPRNVAAVDIAGVVGVRGDVSIRGARARGGSDRLIGVARLGGWWVAQTMRLGRRRRAGGRSFSNSGRLPCHFTRAL